MPVSSGIYFAVMFLTLQVLHHSSVFYTLLVSRYLAHLVSLSVLSKGTCVCLCVPAILLGFSLLMISSHPTWSRLNYSVALRALLGAD